MKRSSRYDSGGPPRKGPDEDTGRITPMGGVLGAALGAVVATTGAGLELLFREAMDLGGDPWTVAQWTIVAGAAIGALGGLAGFGGASALGLYGFAWLGWTVGALVARDIDPVIAPGLAAGVALGFLTLGAGVARLRLPRVRLGLGIGAWVMALAAGLPLAYLVTPWAAVSLVIVGGAFPLALLAGLLGGAALGEAGPVRIGLALLGSAAVVWSAALPLAQRSHPPIPASDAGARPVIVIAIDGLRADHVGQCPHGREVTPTLAAAAKRGRVYTEAWGTSTWPLPAVGSLLTGRWPTRHGAGANLGDRASVRPLRADVASLGRDAGVATAAVLSSRWGAARYGLDRGFGLVRAPEAPPIATWPLRRWTGTDAPWTAWQAASAADEIIRRGAAALVFVEIGDLVDDVPPDPADVVGTGAAAVYDAELVAVDRQLAALLAGAPAGSRIVIVGSHGWDFASPPGGPPTPEALHVPLIVVGAGEGTVKRPVSTVDVATTVAGWLGAQGFGPDGVALDVDASRIRVAEAPADGPERQLADDGRWRLVRSRAGTEVFDLAADPAGVKPAVLTELPVDDARRRLEAALPPLGAAAVDTGAPNGRQVAAWAARVGRAR